MRFPKFLFTLITLGLFTVSILAFTGCGKAKISLSDTEKSQQGVALEDFLPEDTLMSLTINTQNPQQKEQINKLISYFPNEDIDNFVKSTLEDLNMQLTENGLSYNEDIAPLFTDSFKGIIAMTGPFPKIENSYNSKKTNVKKKDIKEEQPDVYGAFIIADSKKAEELIKKIAESDPDIKEVNIFEYIGLDNEKSSMYLALYKDSVLITNSKQRRYEAIKRARNNENSLLSNENYGKAVSAIPTPNLGMAYINVKRLFTEINNTEKIYNMDSPMIKALNYEAFSFVAKADGIQMDVLVGFDPNVKEFNMNDFPYNEPYLYKTLPGKDLILYAESSGIKDVYDLEIDMMLTNDEDREQYERILRIIKKQVGIDVENDVLPWMDKGFTFVIQRNQSIIPGLSIYIDASSKPEGAKKVVDIIDAAFGQMVDSILNEGDPDIPFEKIVKKEIVKFGGENGSDINRVSFDFTQLSPEELNNVNIPEGLFKQPIEIYYGLTKDNLFILSLYTGLDKEFGNAENTVANNPKIKESLGYIKDYPYQLSYISVDESVKYVDEFIEAMTKIEGDLPEDVAKGYEKVKSYLAPIKYLVGGNKKVENIAEGMMFIKMEKPAEEVEEGTEMPAEVN